MRAKGATSTILPLMVRRVIGESMYPTLEKHQWILIRHATHLKVGDIVMFLYEGQEKIKRIHGIEGSFLYVLGDNPRFSKDSRHFGYISRTSVIGRVIYPTYH